MKFIFEGIVLGMKVVVVKSPGLFGSILRLIFGIKKGL